MGEKEEPYETKPTKTPQFKYKSGYHIPHYIKSIADNSMLFWF